MNGLLADCRHAIRLYARTPTSSAIAVIVLAFGIAFVGAFLSLYVDLVVRPHPGFEQSNRLATVAIVREANRLSIPYATVERIANEMTSVDGVGGWTSASVSLGPDRQAVHIGMVSSGFFDGLRPRLALGRGFRAEDHAADAPPVVVLSYAYWQQRFNGDRNVLGTFIEIRRDPTADYRGPRSTGFSNEIIVPERDAAQFQVIGVGSRSFAGVPNAIGDLFEPPAWIPLEPHWPLFRGVPESLPFGPLAAYLRRAEGASLTAVVNELRARYDNEALHQAMAPGSRLDAVGGIVGNIFVQRDAARQLELFLAGSVLLALVAAANVSLFLLARAPGRRRELGIRMAVGAPTKRLGRQLATEGGLLVLVSAVLGLGGSVWLNVYLRGLTFLRDAEWHDVRLLDWRVLSLAVLFVWLLTALVSLAPILGLKRLGIASSSRQVAARASLAQRLTGTAQIAAAGVFAGAAVAFGWYLGSLMFGNHGYETERRFLVDFEPSPFVARTPEDQRAAIARWRDTVEAIPGVAAVVHGSPVPGQTRFGFPRQFPDPTDPTKRMDVYDGYVLAAFVEVLGLRLLHGRVPEEEERGIVVVNQALARAVFGRDDVVGERLTGDPVFLGQDGSEIVGVLEDVSFGHPAASAMPFFFRAYPSGGPVVAADLTAAQLTEALNEIESDLDYKVRQVRPLEALIGELIAPDRARGYLTIATAALVTVLVGFGFFGMMRYLVAAGRREYAIRAALGAGPAALGRLVIGRALLLGLPGLVLGGLLAFIVVAWLKDAFLSRDVSPSIVTAWVLVGLAALLLAATFGPARQARCTKPGALLRED